MSRLLCPDCEDMPILNDLLECEWCKGYYTWVRGGKYDTRNDTTQ